MNAPSTIDGARVLKVADITHARPTGVTRHYREGKLQSGFARLALAQYDGDDAVYVFYCDDAWNCLNDTCHANLADAEEQAAAEFASVAFTSA